jgi:hypothetical protein
MFDMFSHFEFLCFHILNFVCLFALAILAVVSLAIKGDSARTMYFAPEFPYFSSMLDDRTSFRERSQRESFSWPMPRALRESKWM